MNADLAHPVALAVLDTPTALEDTLQATLPDRDRRATASPADLSYVEIPD